MKSACSILQIKPSVLQQWKKDWPNTKTNYGQPLKLFLEPLAEVPEVDQSLQETTCSAKMPSLTSTEQPMDWYMGK